MKTLSIEGKFLKFDTKIVYKTLGEAEWVKEALWEATIERNYKLILNEMPNEGIISKQRYTN